MTQKTGNEEVKVIKQIRLEEEVISHYGGGNFCSMNCYDDWARDFMDRAIDQVSGRITEPYILKEENAWRKTRRYDWNSNSGNGYTMNYFWRNMITNQEIQITAEQWANQSEPNL
jgi:hypothetical protein